uniref:Uncharacterized protein n=1 Tax=Oryza meridionalis TaxID=40149 RepID=A0A0E0EKA5_9ORYZ
MFLLGHMVSAGKLTKTNHVLWKAVKLIWQDSSTVKRCGRIGAARRSGCTTASPGCTFSAEPRRHATCTGGAVTMRMGNVRQSTDTI